MKLPNARNNLACFALAPTSIALAGFYLLVVATKIAVGDWPKYHYPDAGVWSAVPFPVLHVIVLALLVVAAVSGPVGAVGAIIEKLKKNKKTTTYFLNSVFAWVAGLLILKLDPGSFFNWFFD